METMLYQPVSSGMTLVILEQGNVQYCKLEGRTHWTMGRSTSESAPDIALHSSIAGRRHGEFLLIDGEVFYCDKGSVNGTFYNEKKITVGIKNRVKPVMLKNGDILRIDYENLSTPDYRGVWILVTSNEMQGEWSFFSLKEYSQIIIGRDETYCNIILPLPYISSQHAKITQVNGNYHLSDCDSREGIWINGKKLCNSIVLKEKDQFAICDCHFIFTGNGLLYNLASYCSGNYYCSDS